LSKTPCDRCEHEAKVFKAREQNELYGFPALIGKGKVADYAEIVRYRVFGWVMKAYDIQQDRIKAEPDNRILLQQELLLLKRFLREMRTMKRCHRATWWAGKHSFDADEIYEGWLKEKSIRGKNDLLSFINLQSPQDARLERARRLSKLMAGTL
jgi:hypothetical protein